LKDEVRALQRELADRKVRTLEDLLKNRFKGLAGFQLSETMKHFDHCCFNSYLSFAFDWEFIET
jgi:hypothetical protein